MITLPLNMTPVGVHLRWPNTLFMCTFADVIQHAHISIAKTNMSSIERFIENPHYCTIFLYHWMRCINGFGLLLQRYWYVSYIGKVMTQRTQQFLDFFVTKRTQLNAVHAQSLEKLRPIAIAETCRFLTIQLLKLQEIWQNNSSETTWMIYC